jgi:aminodeoxyfutalosine synthase
VPLPLDDLALKVQTGAPLSDVDVDALASSRDIIALGMLANALRQKLHGMEVTYVRVADLKLADLKPGSTGPLESAAHAGEVRIFETPRTLDEAIAVIERARERAGSTPVSAFCLFELSKFSEGLPVVLSALKRAGLALITQAPVDRLTAPEQALEALTDTGLRLARLTVNETPDRPWAHVCREVMALQTALQSIRAFAPLARKIDSTQPTTGYEDVKRVAIARLVAHNVETIQVDWALYGPKLAQVALTFGADDIDSVSSEEDKSLGHRRSPVEEIHRGIQAAGFEPVERDAYFQRRG